jgi:hypothetical protein
MRTSFADKSGHMCSDPQTSLHVNINKYPHFLVISNFVK